jgi:hypothetical protein
MTNELYTKRNAKRLQKIRDDRVAFKNRQSVLYRRRIEDRVMERQLDVTLDKGMYTCYNG